MTHYAVLGVPHDADERSIRSAFRTLVRRYHPDAGEGSSADTFRRLVEAYE
ncbi:MAG: J domain-containing protein, partial [Bryobacteraceae bacterium]|nr:J domain-containing protein [Bryobacteraceae bacterium]